MGSDSEKFEGRARWLDWWLETWGRWQLRFFLAAIAVGVVVAVLMVLMDW